MFRISYNSYVMKFLNISDTIIHIITGAIFTVFATRFLFKILGAEQDHPLVKSLYDSTSVFLFGIDTFIPSPVLGERFVLDLPTLSLLFVIGIIDLLVVMIVRIPFVFLKTK